MTRRTLISAMTILSALGLPACAPMIWDKPGATQQSFAVDDYRCRRESMVGMNYVAVNYGYGIGSIQGRPMQDVGLYKLCMQSAGYVQRKG